MGVRVLRMAAIMGAGALVGLGWNAWSGRGFVLGQSVFVQAGDEVIEAKDLHRSNEFAGVPEGYGGSQRVDVTSQHQQRGEQRRPVWRPGFSHGVP